MDRGDNANIVIHEARQSRLDVARRTSEGLPEKKRPLYGKYKVQKIEKPDNLIDCIVLEWSDPIARVAIKSWAQEMKNKGYLKCACDVFERLSRFNS